MPGSNSAGRVICGKDLTECVSVPKDFLRPQGDFPPGFYPLRVDHHQAPEAPLIRGMLTGLLAFLGMPGTYGLRHCARTHLKRPCATHAHWVGRTSNTADHYRCYTNSTRLLTFSMYCGGARGVVEWRCPWCSRYRRRKWTRRYEFKSWTRLIAFHIALIPLGKVWIQLFSLQLWVNSRTD